MQVNNRNETSERHTQNRAAGGKGNVAVVLRRLAGREDDALHAHISLAGELHHKPCKAQTHDQARHRLKNLADGGRGHVALPLEKAAVGRDQADQQHARRKRGNCCPRVFVRRDHDRQLAAEKQHAEAADHADGQKDVQRRPVNPLDLRMVSERLRLRNHAAHGNRKPRGRNHEQDVIDVIGGVEVAEAVFANDVVERDLE